MDSTDSHIFGPVPSRRLGLSLGVDLIPAKTCTFDCLYCEVGRTTSKTIETGPYVPAEEVLAQLRRKLLTCRPDIITLAGSGEPTLHSGIQGIISGIREFTSTKVALLTNGSLFWKGDVRRGVLDADIIMPTLSSAFEETFRRIHRPHAGLRLGAVVEGLAELRKEYKGRLLLEVVFLAGINDTQKELEALKGLLDTISPDRIQLNTVVRPPADPGARPVGMARMEEIRAFLGPRAEVIAGTISHREGAGAQSSAEILLDTVRRRPLRAVDVAEALDLDRGEVDDIINGLMIKGLIRRQEHSGEIFYMSSEQDARIEER